MNISKSFGRVFSVTEAFAWYVKPHTTWYVQKLISTSRMYKTLRTRVLYHDWDFAGTNKELAVGGLNAAFDLEFGITSFRATKWGEEKKKKKKK